MNLNVWNDNRSGLIGCMTGNMVLSQIAEDDGIKRNEVTHEKGTIFSTPSKVIVGRVCTSDRYLQKEVAHFCNMSASQTEALAAFNEKDPFFLFITISANHINYWMVPGTVVNKVVKTLKPKPSSPTCFVRIYQRGGEFLLGDTQNITKYHKTIPIKRTSKISKAAADSLPKTNKPKQPIPVSFEVGGVRYEGTVAARKNLAHA